MEEPIFRDTIVKVDLDIIRDNMMKIRAMNGDNVAIMAVVKANAYGHGACHIAQTLIDSGASYLAVATLTEALELRQVNTEFPIFILGHTPDRLLKYVVDNNITQTIFSFRQADIINRFASEHNKIAKVHIKVDTGMHRLGQQPSNNFANEILKISELSNIEMEGIFSHLALVDDAEDENQFQKFCSFVDTLDTLGIHFKYKHIADSIACVDYPQYRLNMVRPGALIYGMHSFHINYIPVVPAITMESKVSQIHRIKKGECVGYDYKWKATRDSTIATLPFGYVDGFPRELYNKGHVSINGQFAPVIGVICMDQCMADVTDIPNVDCETPVVIFGSGVDGSMTIGEVAKLLESNKNDILCRMGGRPPHIYLNEKEHN